MLDYDRQERGDVTIFSLKGNLDALTAPSLKKEIESLLASRKINVVFDLAGLERCMSWIGEGIPILVDSQAEVAGGIGHRLAHRVHRRSGL